MQKRNISENVYQIALLPRNSINCYIIDNILVDSGIRSTSHSLLKALKNHTIKSHVLSHAHADHQGGSKIICETLKIPLLCNEKEVSLATSGDVTRDYTHQKHPVTIFQKRCWAGPGCKVSGILKEGDEIGSFTVIESPGHSAGHISFFRERDRLLIVGDTLVNMNLLSTFVGLSQPPDLFTLNKPQNIVSIQKLASLKPKILCFGHGPVLMNKGELEKFVERISV
jgi:glyoxylase-like metal-dependent hydrolase (beta-lactamase superfamily II)